MQMKIAMGRAVAIEIELVELLDGARKIFKATAEWKSMSICLSCYKTLDLLLLMKDGFIKRPDNPDKQDNINTFQEISEISERPGDELSQCLLNSLLKWADTKA